MWSERIRGLADAWLILSDNCFWRQFLGILCSKWLTDLHLQVENSEIEGSRSPSQDLNHCDTVLLPVTRLYWNCESILFHFQSWFAREDVKVRLRISWMIEGATSAMDAWGSYLSSLFDFLICKGRLTGRQELKKMNISHWFTNRWYMILLSMPQQTWLCSEVTRNSFVIFG